jgi:hypothetical protein
VRGDGGRLLVRDGVTTTPAVVTRKVAKVAVGVAGRVLVRSAGVTPTVGADDARSAVWLDWAKIQFRFFGPNSGYTGSFCVFGPVLSSPAHGSISLAMAQI